MDESTAAFASLMERARAGDQEAFAELVRRYEPEVRIVVRVLLGPALRPHLDNSDVLQSVHRSLLRTLRASQFGITTPQQLVGLAVQMARRKVAHKWRKVRRQQRIEPPTSPGETLPEFLTSLIS